MRVRGPYLLLTAIAVGLVAAATAQARSSQAAVPLPAARRTEPVILTGSQLAPFAGAPTGSLRVRKWTGTEWEIVESQVDERSSSGRFLATEDGKLDANDELVFMASWLGVAAPADAWPPGLSREHPRLEVVVTDPLAPDYRGYVYAFWSDQTSPGLPAPLIVFDTAEHAIRTPTYALWLAGGDDGFIGIKALTLFGSPDLVDRLKMRVAVSLFGLPANYTEETIGILITPPRREPLVSGPVRLLFDANGTDVAYAERASLYGSLGGGGGSGLVEVTAARLSLDLAPAAVPATYFDPNVPDGVAIDGQPDAVPASPVPNWHEVRFARPFGRLISVGAPAPAGSSLALYYKDDATVDSRDTGDKMSYGDCGVSATKAEDAGGPAPVMIFLPNDDDATGEALAAAFQQPLVATVRVEGEAPTPTASVASTGTPTAPVTLSPTPTSPATATPTATPTAAVPPPTAPALYLPLARRP